MAKLLETMTKFLPMTTNVSRNEELITNVVRERRAEGWVLRGAVPHPALPQDSFSLGPGVYLVYERDAEA